MPNTHHSPFAPPAPAPLPTRLTRCPHIVFIVATIVLVLAIAWYFRPRGPHPETQNGITFLGTHFTPAHGFEGGGGWFTAQNTGDFAITTKTKIIGVLRFSARSSTGDTFTLSSGNRTTDLDDPFEFIRGRRSVLHINLPAEGFPGDYQWLELIASDDSGVRGVWRLYDFLKLSHALSPTTPTQEAQTVQNIMVRARAWWDTAAENSDFSHGVLGAVTVEAKADVPPSALSRPSEIWGLQIKSLTSEWEKPRAISTRPLPPDYHVGLDSRPFIGPGTAYASASAYETPSPAAQHIAQIKADLTQYDTVMETVTFRNLPLVPFGTGRKIQVPKDGLSLTTPAGVIVALQDAGRPSSSDPYNANDVSVFYRLSSTAAFRPLRSSQKPNALEPPFIVSNILAEKNGFTSAKNYFFPGNRYEFLEASGRVHLKGAKTPLMSVLPQLTVTVAHQTELQTVLLTFTLPVRQGTPKEKWKVD